jgi:hypothetical protein
VLGFVKRSGGDMAVESAVGRGTTFTLHPPRFEGYRAGWRRWRTACRLGRGGRPRAPGARGGGQRRGGVVLDADAAGSRLGDTWTSNADEALKLLSEVNSFGAVFSDVVMPGMSGVELGQEIRRRYPALPVVLTSGYSHAWPRKAATASS